ncbi:hypothetical protein HDV00_002130 [Rhizophlyctis rosea]|nr:hypothetical protein HDV00_002130 [Rhizophlyctis rosea]
MEPFNEVSRPYGSGIDSDPRKQPDEMEVQLYTYQLKSLSWMLELEEQIAKGKGYEFSDLVQLPKSQIWLDPENQKFYLKEDSRRLVMRSRGGILADHMGLGKTMTVLGLIMANPSPRKKNAMWMQRWRGDDEDDAMIQTPATLIVAPPHLVQQWEDEALKAWPDCKVLRLTTKSPTFKTQWDKLTYRMIMEADILLVSFSWVKNKCFTDITDGVEYRHEEAEKFGRTSKRFLPPDHRKNMIIRRGIELKRKQNALDTPSPILELFIFHRMVIDEGHEILAETAAAQHVGKKNWNGEHLMGIHSKYRWYVTGSPFPKGLHSLQGCLQFLQWGVHRVGRSRAGAIDDEAGEAQAHPVDESPAANGSSSKAKGTKDGSDDENDGAMIGLSASESQEFGWKYFQKRTKSGWMTNLQFTLLDMIRKRLYCRRDRASVEDEATIPPIVEEVIMLDFTDVERGMYNNAVTDSVRQRQLCCHMQISDTDKAVFGPEKRTLDEIRDLMIKHTARRIESNKNQLTNLHKQIAEAQKRTCKNAKGIQKKHDDIKYAKMQIQDTVKTIAKLESEKAYFEAIVSAVIQKSTDNCAICMDEITAMDLSEVITENTPAAQLIEASQQFKDWQNKYGTKMARLIQYINQHADGRFIVFSQWDSLLHKVGETLKDEGVPNVFVQGNIHVRSAAIRKFKTDEQNRVVMLSLENAASGTNLTEATHVILMDPVAGTEEEARAIESQAIGRAHRLGQTKQITVVRFIVRDTIEEQLYQRNATAVASAQLGQARFEELGEDAEDDFLDEFSAYY